MLSALWFDCRCKLQEDYCLFVSLCNVVVGQCASSDSIVDPEAWSECLKFRFWVLSVFLLACPQVHLCARVPSHLLYCLWRVFPLPSKKHLKHRYRRPDLFLFSVELLNHVSSTSLEFPMQAVEKLAIASAWQVGSISLLWPIEHEHARSTWDPLFQKHTHTSIHASVALVMLYKVRHKDAPGASGLLQQTWTYSHICLAFCMWFPVNFHCVEVNCDSKATAWSVWRQHTDLPDLA